MIRFARLRATTASALTLVFAAAATACRDGAASTPEATPAAATPDTATLSAEATRLAAFGIEAAEQAPWREAWAAPARLVLDPTQTQSLGAIAEGRVTRVFVRMGDRVRAGQVLVAIHSHEMMDAQSMLAKARAAAAEAETAARVAESAAARAERLHTLKALSAAELERARGALAQAQSLRAQADAELGRASAMRDHLIGSGAVPAGVDDHEVLVRSPIDGVVVGTDAKPGAVVLVGAPLVTVSRTSTLTLVLHVPERALGAARVGATVRFGVAAFPGERFEARVARVAPALDSLTRTVEVQAQVLGGAERLRAEMYATAEILGPPGAPTLAVPATAVQALEGDTVVVVAQSLGEGLQLEAVRVRVGRRTAERAEILAGLSPGAPVVTTGTAIAKAEILRRRAGE